MDTTPSFGGAYLPSLVIVTLCLFSQACISVARVNSGMMQAAVVEGSLSQIGFGVNLELVERAGLEPMTDTERFRRAILRSRDRLHMFQLKNRTRAQDMDSPVHAGIWEFVMQMAIGSPPLTYTGVVDTGSDLIWTQCQPCTDCYKQQGQLYDPSKSATYAKVPCLNPLCGALPIHYCNPDCEYQYMYEDRSFTMGVLASETFTFPTTGHGKTAIPRLAFGCGHFNDGVFSHASGLVGMGRGPLSLISQLGSKVGNKFSYCLGSIHDPASKTSPLFFGNAANLRSQGAKSTPLLQNPANPSFYYLKLDGLSVGGSRLDLAAGIFDIHADGTGGMIIDSGTTITYLEESAYRSLKKAVQASVRLEQSDGSELGLDVCYKMPSNDASRVKFPAVTFHFAGGADYDLPEENAFLTDKQSGLVCLAMGTEGPEGLSTFGNIQQQNFHILYDLGMNSLSFVPTTCDSL